MKRLLQNQGIIQIFLAMLVVIGTMLISMYAIYRISISSIYEKVTQNNSLVVKSLIQSYDNQFRTINNLIHSIHGLPYDFQEKGEDGRIDMIGAYKMQEQMATLVSSIDYIEEAVVFYDNLDIAVTSMGTSNLSLILNNKYEHNRFNANYWRTFMNSDNSLKIFPGERYNITNVNMMKVSKKLIVVAGGNKVRMSSKNILIYIDEPAFLKHVNQGGMIPGSSLAVLDQNEQLIFSTEDGFDIGSILEQVYLQSSDETSLTKGNYEYHVYRSNFNGFYYIEKVPYQFSNIASVGKSNRIIMVTAVLGAVLLSILLSIYLYRPVKRIMSQLGGRHSGNDFKKILSGIIHLQTENGEIKKQLQTAENEAKRGVLLQAIDEFASGSEQNPAFNRYDADFFVHRLFVMAVVQWRSPGDDPARSLDFMTEWLKSALREKQIMASVYYDKDLQFIVLMSIREVKERDHLFQSLNEVLQKLEQDELTGYSARASISKVYASELANCRQAYSNAVQALEYRLVNTNSKVLDAGKLKGDWNMYYPFDKVEKLSNYILNRKVKEGKQIISETLGNAVERNVHHYQLIHIAETMFYFMLRHAGNAAKDNEELIKLERTFHAAASQSFDGKDVESVLHQAAELIVKHIGSGQQEASKLNPTYITQYIELNYMRNLYLDHIAEVTETSPKYFSSYFKKTFGVNYVEYLNKVRLSHARELLQNTNYSVSEVGEKTGYLNSSTFTTTFKKYYGISPSEYRKQQIS
ncbi:helix-turn-helix domain-containing protein [Paenibacillus sp. J5C_2022]|uniref:helix-turn-helix domain-containing protein n=1 Tax=Paenibacillus sp. J5C2022 TaxID=2977129 RepID=UPI0021D1E0F0|nr:helix-turn-helix domain-containing protein [Paenibacillus sp. J5C2022]MCU6711803.1 helix-turn-helix domain-containing protein [Paenibacillus sp. J5C2022]